MSEQVPEGTDTGVLVAVFNTNMIGTEEATTQAAYVFSIREYEQSPKSMHEFVRPYLEKRCGMVENLRVHPTHIRTLDADTGQVQQ